MLSLLLAMVMMALSTLALAINKDQLWLPRDYYRHFGSLNKAAAVSEQTERCQYAIAGTLSQERSTQEHPVFVITCRDQERQTFAYIVDGLSLEILNRPAPPDPEMLAQQALQITIEKKWMACQEEIKKRTSGLRGIAWLGEDVPEARMDGNQVLGFEQDFNASSKDGYLLHYRATCNYKEGRKLVEINARIGSSETSAKVEDEGMEDEKKM